MIGFKSIGQETDLFADGKWCKITINKSGVYKISFQQLVDAGWNISEIDHRRIAIFGMEPGMLPQSNQVAIQNKLMEIPILVTNNPPASPNLDDTILFFANGPDKLIYNEEEQRIGVSYNVYDRENHYFITQLEGIGKRITDSDPIETTASSVVFDNFDAIYHHEKSNVNLIQSGRNWLGEVIANGNSLKVNLPIMDMVEQSDMHTTISLVSSSRVNANFKINFDENYIADIDVPAVRYHAFGPAGIEVKKSFNYKLPSIFSDNNHQLKVEFSDKGGDEAFLDYFTINYKRSLVYHDSSLIFRSFQSTQFPTATFQIEGLSENAMLWDITELGKVSNYTIENSDAFSKAIVPTTQLREFVVFEPERLPFPTAVKMMNNQAINSLKTPDLLIVTHHLLLPAADQLADIRRQKDGLQVEVVTAQSIYNRYSSGKKDVSAIRNFVNHLYQRSDKLKYLLLFGDASYDLLDANGESGIQIPTYQSRNSLHRLYSYSSDDYFGFLDQEEGIWKESNLITNNQHDLEIGVGRIPANSLQEAIDVVNKLSQYGLTKDDHTWKNRMVFVADNGEQNKFQLQSEWLANWASKEKPDFLIDKLFVDAFPIQELNGRKTAPKAREMLNQQFNRGSLILDYIGHGNENEWSNEKILDEILITQVQNNHRLPMIVSATCEFGRFDNPDKTSGGELSLLKKNGGAIAILTSTRQSIVSTNFEVSRSFYKNAFASKQDNQEMRLGDIVRNLKNESAFGIANRNFSLLGDPSMRLAIATNQMIITSIDEKELDAGATTLPTTKSFSMKGEINSGGSLSQNFNGIAEISIYDKIAKKTTIGNFGAVPMEYDDWENLLYKGKVTVTNGAFTFKALLPSTFSTNDEKGKIVMYASSFDSQNDASGALENVLFHKSENNNLDNDPPVIEAYIDHSGFKNGDQTGQELEFNAFFNDESGINLSSSLTNGIVAFIDSDSTDKILLSNFYEPEIDDFTSGKVKYLFNGLDFGSHSITICVSDNFNNRTCQTLEFFVVDDDVTLLQQLNVYPNPSNGPVNFEIKVRNSPPLLPSILLIYSLQGQLIRAITVDIGSEKVNKKTIIWDQKDRQGQAVKPGIYFYDFYLHSVLNTKANKKGKLLIIK